MENVLLFHIGFHKTGSTSIQRFLYDNDTELRKYGWFYPDFSEMVKPRQIALNNGFYLRLPLFKKDRGKMWKIISENLKKYNVIISEEGFSDEDIQTILSEAKKYHNNIKVIVYLRRQDLYIGSFYNQAVKAAYVHGTVNEYMENFLYYSDNYLDRLEKIGRVIGDENIIVRVYEGRQFAGSRKDVLSDFMYTIADGIEPDWERFKMPKRENPALHGRYFEIKKLLNAVEDDQYKRWPAGYVDPILQLSEKYGKSYENALTEGYLTKQDRRNILDKHKKNNAQLARKYLHREDGQLFYDTNIDFPVYENEATPFEADMIRVYSALFHKMQSQIELLPLVTAIKMLKGDRQLAFYGIGERGRTLLDYPIVPDLLIDNGIDKKGGNEKTIQIVGASDIKDWSIYFVIVTPYHCADIEQELQNYGLRKGEGYLLMNDYL